MSFKLELFTRAGADGRLEFAVIGSHLETRKQVESCKRGYAFARSGVVAAARGHARKHGLRSPWRIVEEC